MKPHRRRFRYVYLVPLAFMLAAALPGRAPLAAADVPPNILWITSEDNGPELGSYGDAYADTPNIDAFASRSLRYKRCWSNAPVCAPARTTIISGMYATSLGGHHMRSGVELPADVKLYPQILREAGYYTTNNSKTDYNFASAEAGWHDSSGKAHWRNRPDDTTPFFAVFNFTVSHESKIRVRPHKAVHDPAAAPLPSYHPDTPEVRRDWAQYYDKLTQMDVEVGRVLKQLEADGLADSTIVFYYGDHGSGMPRSKRWPFDSGLHVPLILHVPPQYLELAPEEYSSGGVSDRLTAFVDLAPTALSLAGIQPPPNMQGVPFAGNYEGDAKQFLFGYRGRMDERIDEVRSMTDGRYVYMKHFYPDRPYLKHVDYMFQTPTTQVWKRLFDEGKLTQAQAKFWQPKPSEELFDLENDPDETINLAELPEHADRVAAMRTKMMQWMIETRDLGLLPEAEIHRRSAGAPPRTFGLSDDYAVQPLVEAAFAATDRLNPPSLGQLTQWARSSESGVRFWAMRSLLLRPGQDWKSDATAEKLVTAGLLDESPIVRVAAAEVGLRLNMRDMNAKSQTALIALANVDLNGHFVAVTALNVLDEAWADLSDQTKQDVRGLPRQIKSPPVRVGKYVGRLLDRVSDLDQ